MRILRLVKKAESLRLVFNTFIVTLPALVNVGIRLSVPFQSEHNSVKNDANEDEIVKVFVVLNLKAKSSK